MTPRYVLGSFMDEHDLLAVVTDLREDGLAIDDVYTPYAVHGLDRAMGLRPSRLTWVCFLCAAIGALLVLFFEYWTSAIDWPINVGGKPFDSLPAFVPIMFEAAVLCGGLGAVGALFLRCGLRPGKAAALPAPGVTDDRFVVVVRLEDAAHSAADVRSMMARHHLGDFEERVGEVAV